MRSRSRRRRCKAASARPNRRASRRHECGRVHACPSPLETHAAEACFLETVVRPSAGVPAALREVDGVLLPCVERRRLPCSGVSGVRVGSRPPQAAELVKLNGIINEGDAELQRQRKEYDNVVNERNILGTQVRGCAAQRCAALSCAAGGASFVCCEL